MLRKAQVALAILAVTLVAACGQTGYPITNKPVSPTDPVHDLQVRQISSAIIK